jgi:chromosome segregation ATPase
MTTETRITTIEAQLQQLTINVTTLASITTQQSFEWNQRFNHLAELVASNSKAIEGLTRAIESLNERIDRLDQKLEERTDTLLEAINRGISQAFEPFESLQAQITGLQTEMQRVIEMLSDRP